MVDTSDSENFEADIDQSSSDEDSMSVDGEFEWSGMSSLSWFNLTPKNGDYSKYKEKIKRDLRIGSAYHVGARNFRRTPPRRSRKSKRNRVKRMKCITTSEAFFRHPLFMVTAREQGAIGSCSKPKRLIYKSTRWSVSGPPRHKGLQRYSNRYRQSSFANLHTFQESFCGSLWAVSRLHLAEHFKCHRGCVNALCFNSTGNWIASGSDDLKVVVTDWTSKKEVIKYNSDHRLNIFHLKFLPEYNDTKIVSCACDSQVRLAELGSDGSLVGGCTRLLATHNRSCHKLALPVGEPNIVLSAGADGQVFSIDVRAPKAKSILVLPMCEFFSIACNPARPYEFALCGRSESVVKIFDRRTLSPRTPASGFLHCFGVEHLRGRPDSLLNLDSPTSIDSDDEGQSADGDLVSSQDEDEEDAGTSLSSRIGDRLRSVLNRLRERSTFHDRASPSNVFKRELSRYSITSAVYTNQGDAILASYNDEDIYLFDTRNHNRPYLHKYSGHRNMQTIVSANFFGPNSEYIVSGSDDGFFYIWDRESEGIVQWLYADVSGAVNVVEPHPTLPVLATAGLDYDFKVWAPLRSIINDDSKSCDPQSNYTFGEVPPSIRQLRRSRLAKVLFADTLGPTPPARPATPEPPIESSSSSRPVRKRKRRDSSTSSSSSSHSITTSLDCHVGVAREVSPDGCATSSSSSTIKPTRCGKRSRDNPTRASQRPATPAYLAKSVVCPSLPPTNRPPQHPTMPFNVKDLQLRVAQNWINRACETAELDGLRDYDPRLLAVLESLGRDRPFTFSPPRTDIYAYSSSDEDSDDSDSIETAPRTWLSPSCEPPSQFEQTPSPCTDRSTPTRCSSSSQSSSYSADSASHGRSDNSFSSSPRSLGSHDTADSYLRSPSP